LGKIKALHEATGIRADMRARMSAAFQETERAALSSAG
jgi:hypothetical protein